MEAGIHRNDCSCYDGSDDDCNDDDTHATDRWQMMMIDTDKDDRRICPNSHLPLTAMSFCGQSVSDPMQHFPYQQICP
jgi:hypothetical protein